ncbi:hypothetical protein B7494_g2229 [Chlorociboria aeruginascens]|nr:hypothetical protein B7494_g2229 [Chlorociboria aeruginascens]
MPHLIRRLSTLPSTPSAAQITTRFQHRFTHTPPRTQTQVLDINQLTLLHSTLSRACPPLKNGTPLPPGYHLIYFTPSSIAEAALGRDGTDRTFNPEPPFTRRMWAGGEMVWERGNQLRVGETVREVTRVQGAEAKLTKMGEEMVVVGVEKQFENERGLALVDRRYLSPFYYYHDCNWVFRKEIITPISPVARGADVEFPTGPYTRDFLQTPVSLFRFSALTFNAHQIHYSKQWCQEVEGHRDVVVHGPLNLINMLDFWRDTVGGEEEVPRRIIYRATSPLYAGEMYRAVLEKEGEVVKQTLYSRDGKVAMRGEIEGF